MAEIRLQEYTAKIKELIRHDRHDEAIAHCQHILRHYPRHIETYYLLGEACLEKRMVREAIEFFQRTLSADPEYFLARVGLGIVYDEQGALLEAIWQMERAFELMPGNTEVRRELQRLYAQRDGVEKTRLKLTRGALGRLYSRNGLYEQAIGEFHAILRQDPDLPDIQLALIEALWREGRRVEAVEGCLDLLESLPNCLKANLILGTIWTLGGHEDAGLEKLEVARALDPENRMAQELFGGDSPLPPEEVILEELEPEAGQALVPTVEERAVAPWDVQGEERAPEAEAGEETPDWLRDVGLVAEGEGEEEGEAPAPQVAAAEPSPVEAGPAPGEDVPPWLQELMGEEAEAGPLPEAAVPEEDRDEHPPSPDWLEELESAELGEPSPLSGIGLAAGAAALAAEPAAGEEEPAAAPHEETEAEMPDWLQELGVPRRSSPLAAEGLPGEEELEEMPDWLRELRPDQEEPAPPVTAAEAEGVAGPDEERELQAAEAEAEAAGPVAEEVEEVPGWLRDLGVEVEGPEIEAQAEAELPAAEAPEGEGAAPAEEVPDWLLALGVPEGEAPAAEVEEPEELAAEEVPAWLEELRMPEAEEAAEAPVAEGRVEPGVPAGKVPESLRALVEAGILAEEDLAEAMAQMSPEELEAQHAEAVPEWLQGLLGEGEAEVRAPAVEEAIEEPAAEVPAWLEEPGVPEGEAPAVEVEEPEEPAAEVPAWLEDLGVPEGEAPEPAAEAPEAEPERPAAEEVPAWLEELRAPEAEEAAEAPVAEGRVEPGVPAGKVPESLRALVEAGILAEEDLAEAMAQMSPEELEAQHAEAVPEWLQGLLGEGEAEVRAPAVEEAIEEPAAEVPAWLEEPGVPEAEAPEPAAEVEEPEELAAEVPAWLEDLGVPEVEAPAVEAEEPEELAAEVPAWLEDLGVPEVEAPGVEVEEPEELAAEVPAWLEGPGVPEAEVPGVEVEEPEELAAEVPAWLEGPGVPEAEVEEPAAEEVPAWLEELRAPEAEEAAEAPVAEGRVEPGVPAGKVPESLRALVEAGILAEEDLAEAMAQMSPEELEAQQAEAVPEWLQGLLGEGEAEVRAPAVEEAIEEPMAEVPAWLEEPGVPEAEAPEPEAEEPAVAEVSEWLESLGEREAEAPAADEVPAWMEARAEPVAEAPEAEEPAVAEVSEWLESLGEREAEAPAAEPEAAPAADEVPAWMEARAEPVAEAPEAEEPAAAEVSEWLESLGEREAEAPAAEPEAAPAADEVPAWMEARAEPVFEEPEAEEPAVAEVSEWLESLGEREAEAPAAEPEAAPAADEVPAWLEEPGVPEAEAPEPEAEEPAVAEVSEWLESLGEREAEAPAAEPEAAPAADEVPAWMEARAEPVVEPPEAEEPAPAPEEAVEAPVAAEIMPPAPELAPQVPAAVEEPPSAEQRFRELREELQARPRNHPLRLELARMCAGQKEWKSALGNYEKLIASRKLLPDVLQDLQHLLDEDVDRARVYQLLGDVYMQEDQLDRALEMYRQSRQALLKR